MLLTRKSDAAPSAPRLARLSGARIATMDRRAFLKRSGLGCRRRRFRHATALRHDGQGRGGERSREREAGGPSHRLHALLGRLRDRRRRRERRVGAAGAGVRFAAQPRRALREGRVGARARPRRASAEEPDEARQRQVPEDHVGAGDQRGRRQAPRDPQGIVARRRVLGRLARSTTTSSRTCCASSCRSSARTTATTRRASATRRRSRASRTPGATAR